MRKVAGSAMTAARARSHGAPVAGAPAQPSAGLWLAFALWLGLSATGLFLLNPTQLWMAICTAN